MWWCHSCGAECTVSSEMTCVKCSSAFVEDIEESAGDHPANWIASNGDDNSQSESGQAPAPRGPRISFQFSTTHNPWMRSHAGGSQGDHPQPQPNVFSFSLGSGGDLPVMVPFLPGQRGGNPEAGDMQPLAAMIQRLFEARAAERAEAEAAPEPQQAEPQRRHLRGPFRLMQNVLNGWLGSMGVRVQRGNGVHTMGDFAVGNLDVLIDRLMQDDPNFFGRPPASKAALDALVRRPATEKDVLDKEICSVCTEEFTTGEEVMELPCFHVYHPSCVLKWLEMHDSCPICRFPVESEHRTEGKK